MPTLARLDDRAEGATADNRLRPLRAEGEAGAVARGRYADLGPDQLQRAALGRAQDAYNEIMAIMSAMIAAIMKDPGLTRDQKAAAVRAIRQQKKAEAKAVRRRILREEKDKLKGGRRKGGGGTGKAPAPPPAPMIH